jgi:hypothetical protein
VYPEVTRGRGEAECGNAMSGDLGRLMPPTRRHNPDLTQSSPSTTFAQPDNTSRVEETLDKSGPRAPSKNMVSKVSLRETVRILQKLRIEVGGV